jgi:hypothetical protein
MSKRKRNKNKIKKNKRRKQKAMQTFLIEFNDIINVIVDKLKNPKDGLSEGFIVKYEIDNLSFLAQVLTRKLPIKQSIGNEHAKIPEGDVFLIWHGTSLRRANSILKSGFKSGRFRCYVYFASNIMTSLRYATGRAHAESSEPAIFAAICDPSKLGYGEDFLSQEQYTFQDSIATRIVKYLLTRHGLYSIGEIVIEANNFKDELTDIIVTETKRFRDDLTNITITQNSGNAGIAYWLNSFLGLDDSESISENHPAVGKIKEWVDEQYANGRIMPIADEEILILGKRYLSEYFD